MNDQSGIDDMRATPSPAKPPDKAAPTKAKDPSVNKEKPEPATIKPVPKPAPEAARPPEDAKKPIINVLPMASPAGFRLRHKGLLIAFVLLVIVPTLLAGAYLALRSADQYASTVAFTVRSDESRNASELLGGVGALLGGGSSTDTNILYEFVRSQDLVERVDQQLDLRALYSRHHRSDPFFGLQPDASIEDLTYYWQWMVRSSYDTNTGLLELRVLAFDPDDAQAIAQAIHNESTEMINDLSAKARADAIRYASVDLDHALERLKDAREAVTQFRLKNSIVDVEADIQGQMGLVNTLQSQLASAMIDYDLLRLSTTREGDTRIDQAEKRIDVIRDRIAEERGKFSGTDNSGANYATIMAEYERLMVEREFAETSYLAALTALDGARVVANRRNLYLATYINPTRAYSSEYPRRWLIFGLVTLFSFLLWTIVSLIYYAMRDRG